MRQDEIRVVFPDEGQPPAEGALGPGSILGDYVLGDRIAEGGCGAVYHARHRALDRRAALKVLHATLVGKSRIVERFFREVEVINLLGHPGIVAVHAWGVLPDRRPFYAMEYLSGGTLNDLLRARGRLSPEEAHEVLAPVCAALEAAHAAGVVHRDVKASNIAFTGEPRAAKLLDFGIAKLLTPGASLPWLTTAGRQLGTPTIMAPEQFLGDAVDARTDVYALGVLLYRMLTGRPLFEDKNLAALARRHLEEPPPRPSRAAPVSAAVDAVVLRCLEKRPEHRYESAKAFLAALDEALGRGAGGGDRPVSAPGVAVYVDVRLDAPDDLDDALVADLGTLLDLAESTLAHAGYTLAQTTGTGVLGVRPAPRDPGAFRDARSAALTLALALRDAVARRPGADDRVHVNVAVHAGEVLLGASDPPEILGGPLIHTAAWAPRGKAHGICATEAALAGVPDLDALKRTGLVPTDADTR